MRISKIKILCLVLFAFWLGLFGLSPGYALTLNQAQKLLANDGSAGNQLGFSVSISGDTAVIGAQYNSSSGSAYVFVRSGMTWTLQQKLNGSDAMAGDQFGESVSVSGNTAVVGANFNGANSAYVFVRNGTTWTEQQKLTPNDAGGGRFGITVSVSGDTALIGAPFNTGSGAAYVYVRNGTTWTEQQKLTPSDAVGGEQFGRFVSLSGETALIGAHLGDGNQTDSGSAYVFVRNGTTWTEQQELTASDGATGDRFSTLSVSVSGDTAVIGAESDADNGTNSGSAYVFVRNGTTWTQQQKLTASDGATNAKFGSSASVSGDTAVIGATGDSGNGAGYVFVRSGTTWTEQQKLTASDGAAGDAFGVSASVSGDTVLIGANFDDDNGSNSGSAYVFEPNDSDGDGILDDSDNCPADSNPDQADNDLDLIGDVCDNDDDNDSVLDNVDNCPFTDNTDQTDTDNDGLGDACDSDPDGDGVESGDNCPFNPNPDQTDTDNDTFGDACDADDDNDTVNDIDDNCPLTVNSDQADLDLDNIGDACDSDIDGDGVDNGVDNCPVNANPSQDDTDFDGAGDVCDEDDDNDGICDGGTAGNACTAGPDNCPLIPNLNQTDSDNDGEGDVCDGELDGDGIPNEVDNCPTVPNASQHDIDGDGIGDACDADIDGDGVSNTSDMCASTPLGTTVNTEGCSIDQLCPCEGPRGTTQSWKNHGKYVSCVSKTANSFVQQGLITETEKDIIVSEAGQSQCGK